MARFGVGFLLLLATSCMAAPATPPFTPATTVFTGCGDGERPRAANLAVPVVASPVEPPSPASRTPAPTPGAPGYGTFASTGGLLGTWSTTTSLCTSGVTQSTLGVLSWAHFGAPGYALQLHAKDNEVFGLSITREHPSRSVDLSPEQCSRFDVQLHPQADDSRGVDVDLDCTSTDGARVTVSIHGATCSDA